jgi:hypothetical protein
MPNRLPLQFERAYRVVAVSFVIAIAWDSRFWLQTYRSHATWRIGGLLPLVLVSFVFLGGSVGKLTEDYWSGDAMYHLFFAIQNDAKFATLRETLHAGELSRVATWYSRVAILGEICIAGAMLLPLRIGLPVALLMVIGMWIVSPMGIINALAAAIGLLFAGVLVALVPHGKMPSSA